MRPFNPFPSLIGPAAPRRVVWQVVLLFLGLVGALYAATLSRDAPFVILYAALYALVIQFGLPLPNGRSTLVPLVGVSSLLTIGLQPGLLAMLIGFLVVELTNPFWQAVTELESRLRLSLWQRVALAYSHLFALLVSGGVDLMITGSTEPSARAGVWANPAAAATELFSLNQQILLELLGVALAYFLAYTLARFVFNRIFGEDLRTFFSLTFPRLLTFGLLAQPFALLGVITFVTLGLPAFVIFSIGLAGFSVALWVSWQNRYSLTRQYTQIAAFNRSSQVLRETLELERVLQLTYEQVQELVPVDRFDLFLVDDKGEWRQPLSVSHQNREKGHPINGIFTYSGGNSGAHQPDDLTRWVFEEERLLNLDPNNMHYAAVHNLRLPDPQPIAWLGIPLQTSERQIGVLTLQRFAPSVPFSRWSREVLLTIAGQAGAAIQNALQHGETVRLYTAADEALARRLEQLQALLNSTHEGVMMVNTDGRVVMYNRLAQTLLDNLTHDKLVAEGDMLTQLGYGLPEWRLLIGQLSRGVVPQRRTHVMPSERPLGEATQPRQYYFIELTEGAVLADDGRPMGWMIIFRDVTEEQEQAEWRTNFTHMIVHDLRNPVTTLLSTTNMLETNLEQSGEPDPDVARFVQTAQRGCLNMLDMIDSLMDINRIEAGHLIAESEAMHLGPLLERLVGQVRPLAEERQIDLRLEIPASLPPIWADDELCRRIAVNLLDNALKFTPNGGEIRLSLTQEPAEAEGAEAGVRLVIADTGPGIPASHKERIFERFVRISRGGAQIRGTGIGLSFCKLAVEAQAGEIWVEDAPDGGSQFVVLLPGIPQFDLALD